MLLKLRRQLGFGAQSHPRCSFQITTDGFAPYRVSIPDTFGDCIDYAMFMKVYRAVADGERKYSPAEVPSGRGVSVCGNHDPNRICTSIIERSNLGVRMVPASKVLQFN